MGENSAGGWGVRTVITLVGVRNEQGLQRDGFREIFKVKLN